MNHPHTPSLQRLAIANPGWQDTTQCTMSHPQMRLIIKGIQEALTTNTYSAAEAAEMELLCSMIGIAIKEDMEHNRNINHPTEARLHHGFCL